jgi:hypothetical protein
MSRRCRSRAPARQTASEGSAWRAYRPSTTARSGSASGMVRASASLSLSPAPASRKAVSGCACSTGMRAGERPRPLRCSRCRAAWIGSSSSRAARQPEQTPAAFAAAPLSHPAWTSSRCRASACPSPSPAGRDASSPVRSFLPEVGGGLPRQEWNATGTATAASAARTTRARVMEGLRRWGPGISGGMGWQAGVRPEVAV